MPTAASLLTSGLSSLAKALGPSDHADRPSEAILVPLSAQTDRVDPDAERFRFQYFPDSIRSGKQTNWQQREIPGGSLPLYQWIAGGEHSISLTVMFSCDTDLLTNSQLWSTLSADGLKERNPDIRSAVAWLRQFLLPTYAVSGAGTPVTRPPRKLLLNMPGTGIGLLAGVPGGEQDVRPHSMYVLMSQCEVTHKALFPSGLPRLTEVDLTFVQIAQYGGTIRFPGVGPVHRTLLTAQRPFYPYTLRSSATGHTR